MAVTQYVGSRYVPIFADPIEWSDSKTYEPLTIVLHQGNSYTSKQFVPLGVSIDNEAFWALTGNYNAQVEMYRQEVASVSSSLPLNAFSEQTVKQTIDNLESSTQTDLSNLDTSLRSYVDASILQKTISLINVNDYGADPTGTTDSSAAFQAAINVAIAGRSAGVYVGNGNYLIESEITVNGPLNLFGNPGIYPCELANPNDMPELNSRIDIHGEGCFIVNGFNMGSYEFAPLRLEGIAFVGDARTNSAIVYKAAGGSTRPSVIRKCRIGSFDKFISFVPSHESPQLDCLTVSDTIFRNNNYIFYADVQGISSALFTGCVIDNSFGMKSTKIHGCLMFQNTIIEQTTGTPDSLVDLDFIYRGNCVFDGCYFEALHGHINITGTKESSRNGTEFTFVNNSYYGGANFPWTITNCIVRFSCRPLPVFYFISCLLAELDAQSFGKGSSFVILGRVPNNKPIVTPTANPTNYVGPYPIYSSIPQMIINVAALSDLVIYGVKWTGLKNMTLTPTEGDPIVIQLPYESGAWCVSLDSVPAETYELTFSGGSIGVPSVTIQNHTDTWACNTTDMGLL